MSIREFIALGTSSQVPTRKRNHNGYLFRWDAHGFLFDPGEGSQRQLIFADQRPTSITHLFVTHFHGDHCLGLPGIIQRLSLDGVTRPLPIWYPKAGQVYFDRLRRASIFLDKTHIVPHPVDSDGEQPGGGDFRIIARRLKHPVPTYGYRIEEPDHVNLDKGKLAALGIKGPAVGELKRNGEIQHNGKTLRLEDVSTVRPGQKIAFVMDTSICDNAIELARGADLLVCESTYLASEQREAIERGHCTAGDAARIAKAAGVGQLVLTHFSQRHPKVEAFMEEAAPIFPNVIAVEDGQRVALPTLRRPE